MRRFRCWLLRQQRERLGIEIGSVDEEDGFYCIRMEAEHCQKASYRAFLLTPVSRKLEILLPAAPVFNMAFRYNCGRALMMGVRKNSRQPLWKQRLKSAELLEQVVREIQASLIRETRREMYAGVVGCRGRAGTAV